MNFILVNSIVPESKFKGHTIFSMFGEKKAFNLFAGVETK